MIPGGAFAGSKPGEMPKHERKKVSKPRSVGSWTVKHRVQRSLAVEPLEDARQPGSAKIINVVVWSNMYGRVIILHIRKGKARLHIPTL